MLSSLFEQLLAESRMRHLNHDKTPPLDFIDQVIESMSLHEGDKDIIQERERCMDVGITPPPNQTYKERCSEIRKKNVDEIKQYEAAFNSDNLYSVPKGVPVRLNDVDKDYTDMESLYSFRNSRLSKLWADTLSTDGYLNDMCPICESVKAKTFDHYLPKSQYQLFAVHPLNIIPCCTVCNGHKLKNLFDKNNKRKYWNAYLDKTTQEQYLFCDITEKDGMPKADFRVVQGNLPARYFELVKQTFDDLKLNENYKEASDRVTVGLKNSCCKYFLRNQALGLDSCLQNVADTIYDKDVNNWEYVLKQALITAPIFKMFIESALKQEHGITV